jgi:hypothetical protein
MSMFEKLKTQIDINDLKAPASPEEINQIEEGILFENFLENITPDSHELLEMLIEGKNDEFKPSSLIATKGGIPSNEKLASRGLLYGGGIWAALYTAVEAGALVVPVVAIPIYAGLVGGIIYYLVMRVVKGETEFAKKAFPKYGKLLNFTEKDPVSVELAKRIDKELKEKKPNMGKLKLLRKEFNDNLKYILKYAKEEDLKKFTKEIE